ncbi:MAG: hypothetical protein GEU71_03560 [Actinobacteria bacterium]|nr:hypothetical protein [Actinomycetota bacterium]
MTILRKATDQQQSEWIPVPEGLWRWRTGKPTVLRSQIYDNYQVRFPLTLTEAEKERLKEEAGDPPEGVNQSWRTMYSAGLSLGYVQRSGEYKSTKLVDFLAACFGSTNSKKLRSWIADGGGPDLSDDLTEDQEVEEIEDWLSWVEDLEVYGTVRHEADKKQAGVTWSRFSGPLPVGSIPGQPDKEYQGLAKGKLQAMMAEDVAPEEAKPEKPKADIDAYDAMFESPSDEEKVPA